VSLVAIVIQLAVIGLRLIRERDWRGWGPAAFIAAVLMMASLATFGALLSRGGPAGVFERIGGLIPTVFGIAFTTRLLARRDARLSPRAADPHIAAPGS
jgi:hypothetical protein